MLDESKQKVCPTVMMAGLCLHSPMLHPAHYCAQRRVRGQSDWLGFLCKTLSFSISSRFIPALSLTPFKSTRNILTRNIYASPDPIHADPSHYM